MIFDISEMKHCQLLLTHIRLNFRLEIKMKKNTSKNKLMILFIKLIKNNLYFSFDVLIICVPCIIHLVKTKNFTASDLSFERIWELLRFPCIN